MYLEKDGAVGTTLFKTPQSPKNLLKKIQKYAIILELNRLII